MTGPRWTFAWGGWTVIRLVACAILLTDAVYAVATIDSMGLGQVVMHLLAALAGIAMCWWPRAGGIAAAAWLVLALAVPPSGADVLLIAIATVVMLPVVPKWGVLPFIGGLAVYGVLVSWLHAGDNWIDESVTRLLILSLALMGGVAVRGFRMQLTRGAKRIAQLEEERVQIRVAERQRLARDLHDIVAHQLAIICLQTLSHKGSNDPQELNQAMGRIDHAARTAVSELHSLLTLLDDQKELAADPHLAGEKADAPGVLHDLAGTLVAEGFRVRASIPSELSEVAESAQLTLSRVAKEATTNIMRHAPRSGLVEITVDVASDWVTLTLTNPMYRDDNPGPLAAHSLGRGLRGLAERVDLATGVLEVGPRGKVWVVRVTLPRHG